MPDGMAVVGIEERPDPTTAAVEAALLRVDPNLARDRRRFECEVVWQAATQRRDSAGRIYWPASPLGKLLRERLSEAQNHRCCWCGDRMTDPGTPGPLMATFEHIIPRVLGGSDHPDNLAVACYGCNWSRGRRFDTCLEKRHA